MSVVVRVTGLPSGIGKTQWDGQYIVSFNLNPVLTQGWLLTSSSKSSAIQYADANAAMLAMQATPSNPDWAWMLGGRFQPNCVLSRVTVAVDPYP